MKCFTWNKDSHGLFDYENKDVIKNTLTATYTGSLFDFEIIIYICRINLSRK